MNQKINIVTMANVKSWKGIEHIDNDIAMIEKTSNVMLPAGPCRIRFIVLAICTKGSLEYTLNTEEVIVRPGDLLSISERYVIDNVKPSPDFEGLSIVISVDFFYEIISDVNDLSAVFLFARNHPVLRLAQAEGGIFQRYFYAIKNRVVDEGKHFRKSLVRTLMLAMFYDMSNVIYQYQQAEQPQKSAYVIFTRFIRLVEQYYRSQHRIGWYAQQLGITQKYLSETVKSVSQRTPNEWVNSYIMSELCVMLKHTTKSIKQITADLHFPNQSFLGKYFKQHAGVSPSDYRKRIRS